MTVEATDEVAVMLVCELIDTLTVVLEVAWAEEELWEILEDSSAEKVPAVLEGVSVPSVTIVEPCTVVIQTVIDDLFEGLIGKVVMSWPEEEACIVVVQIVRVKLPEPVGLIGRVVKPPEPNGPLVVETVVVSLAFALVADGIVVGSVVEKTSVTEVPLPILLPRGVEVAFVPVG